MSKTDYEWRASIEGQTGIILDINDNFQWESATVFKSELDETSDKRPFWKVYVGFRVYKETPTLKTKKDKEGRLYEGWSEKYDEWIPLYTPRIQQQGTHIQGRFKLLKQNNALDIENNIDDQIQPEPGHTRVYQVPRPSTCLSEKFLSM